MDAQQKQYTELEIQAQKWLDETDAMQFSQMELLTMFAAKVSKTCYRVSDDDEALVRFYSTIEKANTSVNELKEIFKGSVFHVLEIEVD